jgi:hypothetical protein
MIPKLGLLDEETIDKVANAYLAIEEHGDGLLLFGGRFINPGRWSAGEAQATGELPRIGSIRLVSVPADKRHAAIAINRRVEEAIREAIDRLDVFLRGFRRQRERRERRASLQR